jgi:hypothetical protein
MNRGKPKSSFVLRSPKRGLVFVGLVLAWLSFEGLAGIAKADIIETFDNGTTNIDWMLTTDPGRLLRIEPTGGNPGAYLHGQVQAAVPTWSAAAGATNFLGDYAAKGVTNMGTDINIFVGNDEPNRNLTLDLRSTLGTGNYSLGLEAYYIGRDISNLGPGWNSYVYPLDAHSTVVPAGWTLLRGNGTPGNGQDWQALMHDVEAVGFELGSPGFAYTDHTLFDLGLDNPRLITTNQPPTLDIAQLGKTGFRIGVNGLAGQTIMIQSSANLRDWLPLAINVLTAATWEFIDNQTTTEGRRYYQAALSP